MHELPMNAGDLPPADPSLLPEMRARGGELAPQLEDVLVAFRVGFHDEHQAFAFSQHFRFAAPRSALRQEGGGVVWIGFHCWSLDAHDAQMQAALAVRYSAVKARLRHVPRATEAEVRPTRRRNLQPATAASERAALLQRLADDVPDMIHVVDHVTITGATPRQRQLGAGLRGTPSGTPRAGRADDDAPPSRGASGASVPPPGAPPAASSRRRRGR
jgi:hypothetical protein